MPPTLGKVPWDQLFLEASHFTISDDGAHQPCSQTSMQSTMAKREVHSEQFIILAVLNAYQLGPIGVGSIIPRASELAAIDMAVHFGRVANIDVVRYD